MGCIVQRLAIRAPGDGRQPGPVAAGVVGAREALVAARAAEAAVGRPDLRAEVTLVRGDVLSLLGRLEGGRQVLSEARALFRDRSPARVAQDGRR